MKKLTYFTDGGCEPNPGKGTWAFVRVDVRFQNTGHGTNTGCEEVGHDPDATNNKMEMTAIIRAVENAIEEGADAVEIFTDSQYCVKGFNEWMTGWASRNWTRIDRDTGDLHPVKNADLWQKLYRYRVQYSITMPIRLRWVKGHNGDEFNERCDKLVRTEYARVFGGKMKH